MNSCYEGGMSKRRVNVVEVEGLKMNTYCRGWNV